MQLLQHLPKEAQTDCCMRGCKLAVSHFFSQLPFICALCRKTLALVIATTKLTADEGRPQELSFDTTKCFATLEAVWKHPDKCHLKLLDLTTSLCAQW